MILNNVNELIQITESATALGGGVRAFGKHIHDWFTSGHRAQIQGLKDQLKDQAIQHGKQLTRAKNIGNIKGIAGLGVGSAGTAAGLDQYNNYQNHQQELEDNARIQANREAHPIVSKIMDNPKLAAGATVGTIAGAGAGLGYAASKLRKKQAVTEGWGHVATGLGGLTLGGAAGAAGMEYQKNIELTQHQLHNQLRNYDTAVKSGAAGAGGALGALGVGMLGHAIYKNATADTEKRTKANQ